MKGKWWVRVVALICWGLLDSYVILGAGPRHDLAGLKNFAQVSDNLYRGAQPERDGFVLLQKMGIRTIVSLRAEHDDRSLLKGLKFNYVRIPIYTWDIKEENMVAFLYIATDPALQPVFVHCQHGADRTGMMVAAYRMYVQKWGKAEAIKELESFGFWDGWVNIKKLLQDLDMEKLDRKIKNASKRKIEYIQ